MDGSHPDRETDSELVDSVERVDYAFLLRYPPYLHVSADGHAGTGAASEADLRARKPDGPVSDGILELDFVARRRDPIGGDALASVRAEIVWKEDVYAIRGVRVHSATQSITVMFGDR